MMVASEALAAMEPWYGYELAERVGLTAYLDDLLSLNDDDVGDEEIVGEQVERNVHWAAEGWEGDSPAEIGWAQRMQRLNVNPAPPMPPQTADLLARHLAGLYVFHVGKPFSDRRKETAKGAWLVDLNPRLDKLSEPVYFQNLASGHLTPWYLFDDPVQLFDCEDKFVVVRASFEEQPAKHAKAAKQLLAEFPRVCRQMSDWFGKHGVPTDSLPQTFPDPSATQLVRAHAALGPIAECLVARAGGDRKAKLAAKAATQAVEVAATAPDYPPHLMVALLAPALTGKRDAAAEQAERILKKKLGVPLTRRWAQRVLDGSL